MLVRCDRCQGPVEIMTHEFYEGTHHKPAKRWSYMAPLYHDKAANKGYCSPACATLDMTTKETGDPKVA